MWEQNYDPLGSAWLSTLTAAVPVVLLLALLGLFHVAAHRAALLGLGTAAAVALGVYGMPADALAGAAVYGAAFGLLPIGWTLIPALFLYNLTVAAGQFAVVRDSIVALSADRRIHAVLIAFCFGAFLEGAAGFGFPVAISAALLMGLGFSPLHAAGLALIANTSPVAFGSLGTPIATLAAVTVDPGVDIETLASTYGRMAGRQLPFFSLVVPIWLVVVMGGFRALRGMWPALLTAGGVFAIVQHLCAEHLSYRLVDVAGGLASLAALALLLRFWQPPLDPQFTEGPCPSHEPAYPVSPAAAAAPALAAATHRRSAVLYAWTPWLLLSVLVLAWSHKDIKAFLDRPTPGIEIPALHKLVAEGAAVRGAKAVEDARIPAVYKFNWLSATGTGILTAAVLSVFWLRIPIVEAIRIFGRTLVQLRLSILTIVAMLSLGYVTKYSGQDVTLGLAFTATGALFPFFSAMLGWLGVALTGSDTSSNVLFGNLQKITGQSLADAGVVPLDRGQAAVLLCTANSSGGVMGKMIDAQSIVVAAAATGRHDDAGNILRFVFWHSIILAAMMGALVMIQAYWWTSAVPR